MSEGTARRLRSGNTPGVRTSANATELAVKRAKALEWRVGGMTYNEIAKRLGVSYETAQGYVKHLLARQTEDNIAQMRAIEDERLDRTVEAAYAILEKYPKTEMALKAIDRIQRAVQIRANLHGLNAPVEVTMTEHTALDAEIAVLLRQQDQLNQQTRNRVIEGVVVQDDGITT